MTGISTQLPKGNEIKYDDLTVDNLYRVLYPGKDVKNLFTEERTQGFKYNNHSAELFERLASSNHPQAITYLLQNPYTPTSVLQQIIEKDSEDDTLPPVIKCNDYSFLLGHPNLTSENIVMLIQKQSARILVAGNLNETFHPSIFEQLDSFGEFGITLRLALNPATPISILEKYGNNLGSGDNYIARQLADNPSTPTKFLRVFAAKNDEIINDSLILNPSTPLDLLPPIWNKAVTKASKELISYVGMFAEDTHPVIGWKAQLFSKRLLDEGTQIGTDGWVVTKENYLTLLHDYYPDLNVDAPIEWLQQLTDTLPNEVFMVTVDELKNHKWVNKNRQ